MLTALALLALALILTGAYRLHRAYRTFRSAQACAAYRAAALVITERDKLRAQEREWGREPVEPGYWLDDPYAREAAA